MELELDPTPEEAIQKAAAATVKRMSTKKSKNVKEGKIDEFHHLHSDTVLLSIPGNRTDCFKHSFSLFISANHS